MSSNKKKEVDLYRYTKEDEERDTAIFINSQQKANKKVKEVYEKARVMVKNLNDKLEKEMEYKDHVIIDIRLLNLLDNLRTMDPNWDKLDEFDITEQQVKDIAYGKLDPITMYNHISYTIRVDNGKGIGIRIKNSAQAKEYKEAYMKELKRLGRSPDNPTYQPPLKDTKKTISDKSSIDKEKPVTKPEPTPATKSTTFDKKAKGQELLKRLEAVVKAEKRVIKETKDDDDFDESLYWTPEEVAEVKDIIKEAMTMDDLEEAKVILKSQESDIKVHETEVGIEYKPPVVKSTSDKASKAREAKALKAEQRKAKEEEIKKKEQAKTEALKQDMQRLVIKKKAEKELAQIEQEKELAKKFGKDWQDKFNKISEELIEADNQIYEIRKHYEDKLKEKEQKLVSTVKEKDKVIDETGAQIEKYDKLVKALHIPKVLTSSTKKKAVEAIKAKKFGKFDAILAGGEEDFLDPTDPEAMAKELERIKKEERRTYNREYKRKQKLKKNQ